MTKKDRKQEFSNLKHSPLHKPHAYLATCVAAGSAMRLPGENKVYQLAVFHQQIHYILSVLSPNDLIFKQILLPLIQFSTLAFSSQTPDLED